MRSEAARPRRAVLDTNVLASALEFGGLPLRILELCGTGLIDGFTSPFILAELAEVLSSPKFRWEPARIEDSLGNLSSSMRMVEPRVRVHAIRTRDSDNRILECALESRADAVVTGNMRHLRPLGRFQGIDILTPREFLDRYFPVI